MRWQYYQRKYEESISKLKSAKDRLKIITPEIHSTKDIINRLRRRIASLKHQLSAATTAEGIAEAKSKIELAESELREKEAQLRDLLSEERELKEIIRAETAKLNRLLKEFVSEYRRSL